MTDPIANQEYAGPERRRYTKSIEQLEQEIRAVIAEHEERERQWIQEMRNDFSKAFPNEDPEGHCQAHEAMIKAHEAQEAFWNTVTTAAVNSGVAALFQAIKWVLLLAVVGALFNLGLGDAAARMAKFIGGAK